MSKIIVTGGTGHIGNVLLRELVKTENNITALILPNEDISYIKDLNINIVYGDITDRDFMFNLIQQDDVVFHLAGLIDIDNLPYDTVEKVNVEGTKNVVDACIKNKAKRLIYTSSVHTIEPVEDVVLTEPTVFDDTKLIGNYAKSKTVATRYVMENAKQHNLDAVIVYPSGVIGPYDYKVSELGQLILEYVNKKLTAYVRGGYNFVDVRDVVDGIIKAYHKGTSGEGYILSGYNLSLKDVFKILNKKLKRNRLPNKIALWFVKSMVPLANAYYKIRHKKPLFTYYSLYTINTNANFSNEKAKKFLGYITRPIENTLSDTVDWFIKHKPELINKKVLQKLTKPQTT